MYLLDTNICIYLLKNRYPYLTQKLLEHNPSDFMISVVTVFELEYGAAKSHWGERTRSNLALFLAPFTILPFNDADAMAAGKLRAYLEQAGTPIGPYDLQIASQAISRNLTIITHNTSEFSRVPGLQLEDWVGDETDEVCK